MKNFTSACCLLALLCSCSRDVPIDLPAFKEKLVVESYLVEGDTTILVRLDKTFDPYKFPSRNDDRRIPSGANVALIIRDSVFLLTEVSRSNRERYTFAGTVYRLNRSVEPTTNYKLVVDFQGLHAESQCQALPKTRLLSVVLGSSGGSSSSNVTFHLRIVADFPPERSYHLVRIEGRYANAKYDIARTSFTMDGHSNQIQIDISNLSPLWLVALRGTEYTIALIRTDRTCFDFLRAIEAQVGEYDSFLGSETTEIPTNIIGGYGIFTGMSKDTMSVVLQ